MTSRFGARRGRRRTNVTFVFLGTGTHAPRHTGSSRHNLGNKCYLVSNVPGCEGEQVCHWLRECPNRAFKNGRKRRAYN